MRALSPFTLSLLLSLLLFAFASAFAIPARSADPALAGDPKIEGALERAVQGQGPSGEPLHVVLELDTHTPSAAAAALPPGVDLEAQAPELGLIRVTVTRPEILGELARLPWVRFIRRPYQPIPLALDKGKGESKGEGEPLGKVGALPFHALDFRGQEVRVAVIDVGFAGLSWSIQNRALPKEVIADATDYTGEGLEQGPNHGTAVAELVHQVAPQALLYLKRVGDEVDLANAVEDAIHQGVRIIVHSVGWVNTNFNDGTGVIDEIAARAARAGILWVNAAGNHARQHWQGPFRDDDGDGWLEFAPGVEELRLRATFGQVELYLTWNDWPRTCQDYDLFLLDAQGEVVASSEGRQGCTEPPTEEIEYLIDHPGYYVRVRARNRLKPVELKIFSFGSELEPFVPQGSILAPADSPVVLAVGAIPVGRWETGPQEPFSSQGPTSDGRIKPDLCGPDNVWTFTPVGFLHRFRGTSAAAPIVAGAAALLLSQHPDWSAGQLRQALEAEAVDMGPPGRDNICGAGRVELSLGPPRAVLSIETGIGPGHKVVSGEGFTVEVALRMPPFTFGGLTYGVRLPRGFRVVPLEGAGAQVQVEAVRTGAEGEEESTLWTWHWPFVPPDAGFRLRYRVLVPAAQPPGRYVLRSLLNGREVDSGSVEIEVIPPLTPIQAVAHWDPERRRLDLEGPGPGTITAEEVAQALAWWAKDAPVPGTAGKVLDSRTVERLIAYSLTRTPITQPLPLPALAAPANALTVEREVHRTEEGFRVTLTLRALTTIYGLRLVEHWRAGAEAGAGAGAGFSLSPLRSPAGTAFKQGTGEFIIPRAIAPGEELQISYRVEVKPPLGSATATATVEVTGWASSALPQISVELPRSLVEVGPSGAARLTVRNTGDELIFMLTPAGVGSLQLKLTLYDLAGRPVATARSTGNTLEIPLPCRDPQGRPLANGVYLYMIEIVGPEGRRTRELGKVVILR